jgi:hypothetical protein
VDSLKLDLMLMGLSGIFCVGMKALAVENRD